MEKLKKLTNENIDELKKLIELRKELKNKYKARTIHPRISKELKTIKTQIENIIKQTNLKNINLSKMDLYGINFNDLVLEDANLTGANLTGADLTNAKFNNVDLSGANLTGADLTNAKFNNVDLSGAILNSVNLNNTEFNNVDLSNAKLIRTQFINVKLEKVNLSGADLTRAKLSETSLFKTNLTNSILEHTNLLKINLIEIILINANFTNAELNEVIFVNVNFTNANLTNISLNKTSFKNVNLTSVNLTGASLTGAFLNDIPFNIVNFTDVNFTDASLNYISLKNANLQGVNFTNAKLNHVDLSGANLTNAILLGIQLNNIIRNQNTLINESLFLNTEDNKEKKIIILNKNIYNGSKSNKNTCKSYKKLFDFINNLDLDYIPIFKYENKNAIDAGGLTRDIFDKYLSEYLKLFFSQIIKNDNEYVIIKQLKNKEQLEKLAISSEQLKKLAIYAKTKIVIPIEDKLLKILQNPEPQNEFSNLSKNTVNNLFKSNHGNKRSNEYLNILGVKFKNLLLNNNNNNNNNKKWNNFSNEQKKEILLRFYLKESGFISYKQYLFMKQWIKIFWNKNVTNKISFSLTDFSKRIIITTKNSKDELDEIKFNSNNKNKLLEEYPNLKLLINYIKESNENRKKFNKWVTGSENYNNIIKIFVQSKLHPKQLPFEVHTCLQQIDVFKTMVEFKNSNLSSQINGNINSSNFSIA